MAKRSVELREKAKAKHNDVAEVIRLAGDDRDFSNVKVLEKLSASDSADAVKKFTNLYEEEADAFRKAVEAERDEQIAEHKQRGEELERPARGGPAHPTAETDEDPSLGRLFVESDVYKKGWKEGRQKNLVVELPISLKDSWLKEQKTLMTTTAGFAPRPARIPRVVEFAVRPIQVLDLIPMDTTVNSSIIYMEQTTRTISAAETAEGAVYQESAYVWTERTSPVRKVTDSIPVTDEQLDDIAQIRQIIDQQLTFGVRQRLDRQVLIGDGAGVNLTGVLNVAGIQTQARGTDPHFDAFYKAITKVRLTGRAEPSAISMHHNDWQTIRLTRTADGLYILGSPDTPGPMRLWGIDVTLCDALTAGTGLVGDFTRYSQVWERKGIEVQVGFVADQFKEGEQTIRADMRAAFVVYRAAAFASVTGL